MRKERSGEISIFSKESPFGKLKKRAPMGNDGIVGRQTHNAMAEEQTRLFEYLNTDLDLCCKMLEVVIGSNEVPRRNEMIAWVRQVIATIRPVMNRIDDTNLRSA